MKKTAFAAATLICTLSAQAASPNFLVILLDDAGWRDLGFTGNTYIETPNLDRLAEQSIQFPTAYATHPFCAPSRQSLVTGQWPARTAWTQRSEVAHPDAPRGAAAYAAAGAYAWSGRPLEFTSLAEALKGAGYATAHIGKWHFGEVKARVTPESEGFDVNFGGGQGVGAVKNFFAPYQGMPGNVEAPEGEYLTDRLTQETIDFIRDHKTEPFYVQLWHYAPHTPIMAPEKIVQKYRKKREALGDNSLNPTYAAMIDVVDQGVGRIFQTLEKLGLADNTVILFASDNGGVQSLGSVPVTSMLPLRGHKQVMYEGGVREPMFIHWPGVTAGSVCGETVSMIDFYPTILDLAGVPLPDQPVDGVSLVPLLKGESMPSLSDRPLFWYNVTHGITDEGETFQPVAAVRKGQWRLIKNFEKPLELYDLSSDAGESNNLAESHPEKAAELEKLLDHWLSDTGVVVPTKNPAYDPDYVIPRQVDSLPEGYEVSKVWKLDNASCGWQAARMIKTSFHDGAMRLQEEGGYPEIRSEALSGLPAGRYAVQLELNVPTSGRIRMAWRENGARGGDIEFFPQRDGQWHTLTAVFEAEAPLAGLRLAAPTHLKETGHYNPETQPNWIEVRSVKLLSGPAAENEPAASTSHFQPSPNALVFDDFNRAEIGPGWKCDTDGVWKIQNGRLVAEIYHGKPKPVLYNTNAESGPGTVLSATCTLNTPNRTGFVGLAAHYQSPEEQYIFRFNGEGTVQFLGANGRNAILTKNHAFMHLPGTSYRLSLRETVPDQFELEIKEVETGRTVFSETVSDSSQRYRGGFGGVYNSAGSLAFDDFQLVRNGEVK
ncbi:sulfatase [Tichowtungia aerotolerans]|uniref:Sulfatase-like hydrolase/transferase n=1 Tax=Tichowtungia aerotolerans TaxID=2697043 RepID=A0A6P1M7Z0_9BACT|nr:sulfatase [Tichowtungia aerotolerans]QHI69183.1 sulfatase-like hydrolase/transferase [Tichowtungia aerotolerans]